VDGANEIGSVSDDGDLGDPAGKHVDSSKCVGERRRGLRHDSAEQSQDLLGVIGVARLAGERAEPNQ
jgi:hypothetical protein